MTAINHDQKEYCKAIRAWLVDNFPALYACGVKEDTINDYGDHLEWIVTYNLRKMLRSLMEIDPIITMYLRQRQALDLNLLKELFLQYPKSPIVVQLRDLEKRIKEKWFKKVPHAYNDRLRNHIPTIKEYNDGWKS